MYQLCLFIGKHFSPWWWHCCCQSYCEYSTWNICCRPFHIDFQQNWNCSRIWTVLQLSHHYEWITNRWNWKKSPLVLSRDCSYSRRLAYLFRLESSPTFSSEIMVLYYRIYIFSPWSEMSFNPNLKDPSEHAVCRSRKQFGHQILFWNFVSPPC